VVIGVVSLGLLLQRNARVSEPLLVAAAAIVGVVAYGL
jgi:hypothetical protein